MQYATQATGKGIYNLKMHNSNGIYSGSQVKTGVYGSARDAGNILAGATARKFGLGRNFSLTAFGAVNMAKNNLTGGIITFLINAVSYAPGSRFYTPHARFLDSHPTKGEDKDSYNGIIYGYDKY